MNCKACDGDGRIYKILDRHFTNRCRECNGYGEVPDNFYDICDCGDYRHQHDGGTGKCTMPNDLCHGFEPCLAFQLN